MNGNYLFCVIKILPYLCGILINQNNIFMKKNTLKNAQITTLIFGCLLGTFSFVMGASYTMNNPIKQNYIILIAFSELIVIFSLISIFTNKSK